VHTTFAANYCSVRVERDAWHPSNPVSCKHDRPSIPFFTRHVRVDKDVLQLARAAAAGWSQTQPGPPLSYMQMQPSAQVRDIRVVAGRAICDFDLRISLVAGSADDLHEASHDTETQTTR
jgi:hypothetical protein